MNKKIPNNKTRDDFAFSREWTLFEPVSKDEPNPDFAGTENLPVEMTINGERLAGQKAIFEDNRLDTGAQLGGKKAFGKTAYLLALALSGMFVSVGCDSKVHNEEPYMETDSSKLIGADADVRASFVWPGKWQVFGVLDENAALPSRDILASVPLALEVDGATIGGQAVHPGEDGVLDFTPLFGAARPGKTAFVFLEIEADQAQEVRLGFGADWWLQAWLNGSEVIDTLEEGNYFWPPGPDDHEVNVTLQKGRNVLAVRCISGSGSWKLALGYSLRTTSGCIYLDFVEETVNRLRRSQSVLLGENPYLDSPPCLTITSPTGRSYTSLGARTETSFTVFAFPEKTPDVRPTSMDLTIWPVLEKLGAATGDVRYDEMVQTMAGAFADYGFDPRSGLAYWGVEAEFDVAFLGPKAPGRPGPRYKPSPYVPRDIMWRYAPDKMAQLSKSAYYGLITKPETMDYNRYCYYGFDDRRKQPSMPWQAGHLSFSTTGAWLIEDWVDHYCRTGDAETLDWARRMTAKWAAVQNPDTGLIPHFFGKTSPQEQTMTVQPFCNVHDSLTATAWLRAGRQLARHGTDAALAEQLSQMGLKLMTGVARYAYDPQAGLFREWLSVDDGQEFTNETRYTFRTQQQKDYWVKIDPKLEDVSVFEGSGFYRSGAWTYGTGVSLPLDIAQAAEMTGDEYLLERAVFFSDRIMEAAGQLDGPVNSDGQWTYSATAGYIEMMLVLHRMTGQATYLERAKQLADMEMAHLKQADGPYAWWQMCFRNKILNALLDLSHALKTSG